MQGVEVGIEEVLLCRERRVDIQNEMIKKYNTPLISFTMNIPGPIKTNGQIKKAFNIGKNLILENLKENNIVVLEIKELDESTGNELFISVDSTADKVKNITVNIEESSQLGRLFDVDVIDVNFEKLSRKSFRKCLICEEQAQECGRSRKHSIEELQNKVEEILEKELLQNNKK
ncbi:citrate lyase holo-[acyl-carrier protein] synthase [Fusobacterium pseudoperiodonticum]|uniref:citrate lyase holo-[acyl-carrier protein] synthase n=1 Tax=Fusobacterium pseudoperiodonticum TaxID=2663009 RepID=A0A2G9EI42_9FUSO|nr:citrate lyase holo-[acyl-carrier protein] synthase [Fusobacterium pseudoperiodonticum]PIM80597.1 citrate lyase holo-[acyl-carrier protein] synthase [Fusobacterium pseudoperiodonticum]